MAEYFINCDIDKADLDKMIELRPIHKKYISKTDNLLYGGLIVSDTEITSGICFFIKARSKSDALDFIENDPYFPIYNNVVVRKFEQKFPKV